jgi:hypothetical protein
LPLNDHNPASAKTAERYFRGAKGDDLPWRWQLRRTLLNDSVALLAQRHQIVEHQGELGMSVAGLDVVDIDGGDGLFFG